MTENVETAVVPHQRLGDHLMMQVPLEVIRSRVDELQKFQEGLLKEGTDYGTVPGVDTPFLHKPGAEKLCLAYGLRPEFEVDDKSDWTLIPPRIDFNVKCVLIGQSDGEVRGQGVGNCNSWEVKYRYRHGRAICPVCEQEAIIKGKEEFGGGWVCWKKEGGCGTKFRPDHPDIQGGGKVLNQDVAEQKNTILKQAKKRAYVDAALTTTAASGIFTQDPEAVGGTSPDNKLKSPVKKKSKPKEVAPEPEVPTLETRIEAALSAFKALGVERETIESYFGRPPDEWDDGHLEVMTEKHYAIKNSNITARDAFSDEIVLGQT